MTAYFGNGYLLNILQRGASPVGKSRAQPGHEPLRLEKTVETTGAPSPEVSNLPTLEAQTESVERPVAASTIPATTKTDPQRESQDVEVPEAIQVATRFESREPENVLAGTNAGPTLEASDARVEEPNETIRSYVTPESGEPSLPVSVPILASSPTAPSGHAEPVETSEVESPPEIKSTSNVLELRMPANFFGHVKVEAAGASQAGAEHEQTIVAAGVESQPESTVTVNQSSVIEPTTVITSQRPNESSEPKTIRLTQSNPIAESQIMAPVTNVLSEVVNQETQIASPARPSPPETLEAAAPLPRIERASEYLQIRQPPVGPAPVAPAPRLRINRMDIQIINQVSPSPPKPPPTQAPDVSQLLEKKHLGRVELLL